MIVFGVFLVRFLKFFLHIEVGESNLRNEFEYNNYLKGLRYKKDKEPFEKYLESERIMEIQKRNKKKEAGFIELPFGDKLNNLKQQ